MGQDCLTCFPFFGDLFREIDFDEGLIGNIFLIGENLKLIEHLARQSQRNRFHRSFDARVKLNFVPARLGKSKYSVVSWLLQKFRWSCSFLNFGTGLIFFFIHCPLVSAHWARADHARFARTVTTTVRSRLP